MNDIKLTSDKIGKEEVKKLRQKLLEDFLHTFPLNSLQGMTLEQYTNLNKDDSFCYWLESLTYELGSIWSARGFLFQTAHRGHCISGLQGALPGAANC